MVTIRKVIIFFMSICLSTVAMEKPRPLKRRRMRAIQLLYDGDSYYIRNSNGKTKRIVEERANPHFQTLINLGITSIKFIKKEDL